jgi:cyanophycinase
VREASLVFFTGGDQLRITSQLAGTPVYACLEERHLTGMAVAGTSAGAAAMPETMIISGASEESYEMSVLGMAPGLGLVHGVVIDSHFAERGRFGRLLGAVTENPRNVGIGIDEDTAIVVGPDRVFQVIGSGAIYVMDGTHISFSSLSERPEGKASVFDIRLHVLAAGDRYELQTKEPHPAEAFE